MPSSVSLIELSRRFAGAARHAVDGVSLVVEPGEIVTLVGPSGCGKSTTLRMIAGLERPDSGDIRIGDRSVARLAPQDRDVAMVFQGFALYPHLSVFDNLAFPLRMRRTAAAEIQARVREVAELLSIGGLLDRSPSALSGGEQQRVAMGRAIVRRPEVFLFDEPLSNLDAALRATLRVELGKLLRRLGATALYVTHDQVEAMTLSDRIAVLNAGRLEQLGSPREIYEAPGSRFVASFFGSPPMNLLEAEAEGGSAELAGARFAAPKGASGPVWLGIRPEHVVISGDARPRSMPATVMAIEALGAESILELTLAEQVLRVRQSGFGQLGPGAAVHASFDESRIEYFDRATGLVLR